MPYKKTLPFLALNGFRNSSGYVGVSTPMLLKAIFDTTK